MRLIQCPRCTAYMQGDFSKMAALPVHRIAYAEDVEMELAESLSDPDTCPASEGIVWTHEIKTEEPT